MTLDKIEMHLECALAFLADIQSAEQAVDQAKHEIAAALLLVADDKVKFKEEILRITVARLVEDGMEEKEALVLAEKALNSESRFKLPTFEEL